MENIESRTPAAPDARVPEWARKALVNVESAGKDAVIEFSARMVSANKNTAERMKHLFVMVTLSAALAGAGSPARGAAQEHKHEAHKEESKTPATTTTEASKGEGMKCCEGMEKMGGMKGDMKAKMEKMKAMKEKMAEKMKSMDGMKMKGMKNDAEYGEPNKDAHQH